MKDFAGKIAVVTGASRGIGRETALRLAARGAAVCVHYNQATDRAQAVVAEIASQGGTAFALAADLGERRGAQTLMDGLDAELTKIFGSTEFDILVNNAGTGVRAVIEDVLEEDFDHMLQVDLKSPFFLIKLASPHLRQGGRIINISSMGTRAAFPVMAAYSPAKAGLEALTLLLAQHFGPRGITVNAVLPGATATDMNPAAQDPVMSKTVAQSIALGRVGNPDDVAEVIVFLASEAGRWITGQRIDASGGQRL